MYQQRSKKMVKITQEQIQKYRLTERNGWYHSQQGLVLTDDKNENTRDYLSKVFKLNEIDDKNQEQIRLAKNLLKKIWQKE